MRLVYKLTAFLLVGFFLIFAVYGALTVEREVAMFDASMARDARLLARTLLAAVERVWRLEGRQAALELIEETSRADGKLDLRWVEGEALRDRLGPAEQAKLAGGGEVVRFERGAPGALRVYLSTPGHPGAALELTESLDVEQAYVSTTIKRITLATLATVIVSGLVALGLGVGIVGRPVQALIEKARRVGTGDLSRPLVVAQRDELGQLAGAMNEMCAQLAASQEQLAAETALRLSTLEQLRHAERLATVGQLASGIAHELGTPLNVVLGRAKMIAGADLSPGEVTENAEAIAEQSRRMAAIIRQLLDFARRGAANKRRVDLREVVQRISVMLAPLAAKAQVELELDTGEVPHEATVDEAQLAQALTNLVVNAVQAMNEGGTVRLELSEETRSPPPEHGGSAGAYLRLSVIDQGPGIPAEVQARVFEPFFTTKEVGAGTGLGLPVAHGIVTDHGGWIEVAGEPAGGTRFSVYLPPGAPA